MFVLCKIDLFLLSSLLSRMLSVGSVRIWSVGRWLVGGWSMGRWVSGRLSVGLWYVSRWSLGQWWVNLIISWKSSWLKSNSVTGYKAATSQKILLCGKYFPRSLLKFFATTMSQTTSGCLHLILKYHKAAQTRQVSAPKFKNFQKTHAPLHLATHNEKYI